MPSISQPNRSFGYVLRGGSIITVIILLVYWPLWQAMNQPDLLPWGSDTLGHLLRYQFVHQNILVGNWFPQIMPDWYMGMQLLRYYAPLPYDVLFLLHAILGNPVAALHGFVIFWALFGSLSWLFFQRFLGKTPAVIGGILFTLLPDLIRVAFSEGNLPRVMASGLTPLLLFSRSRFSFMTNHACNRSVLPSSSPSSRSPTPWSPPLLRSQLPFWRSFYGRLEELPYAGWVGLCSGCYSELAWRGDGCSQA